MVTLYRKKAVLHSLIWLFIYLALNTITGNFAEVIGVEPYFVSAVPNLLLAAICFLYSKKTKIADEIGLLTKSTAKPTTMLYYLPLLTVPFFNLFFGINLELSLAEVILLLTMYIGVGFMEEIIFRGFLFKALSKKWNHYVVVLFISFTFAIGHIISMVAIDQSARDTMFQIINAFVVGFMFMIVVLASGNLTICIITHILYNFIANISLIGKTDTGIIMMNAIVTALYFIYLLFSSNNIKSYFKSVELQLRND